MFWEVGRGENKGPYYKRTTAHWLISILGGNVGVVEFAIGGRREVTTRCRENGCVFLDGV
jgi:hypothetical protein